VKAWNKFKVEWERLEHVNMEYGNIIRGLMSREYSDQEIEQIVGGNFLSFFEKVAG
jgi:microsomal dipeptidase-like Zn-dependent dipeptidase